jgi:hypothetical protein
VDDVVRRLQTSLRHTRKGSLRIVQVRRKPHFLPSQCKACRSSSRLAHLTPQVPRPALEGNATRHGIQSARANGVSANAFQAFPSDALATPPGVPLSRYHSCIINLKEPPSCSLARGCAAAIPCSSRMRLSPSGEWSKTVDVASGLETFAEDSQIVRIFNTPALDQPAGSLDSVAGQARTFRGLRDTTSGLRGRRGFDAAYGWMNLGEESDGGVLPGTSKTSSRTVVRATTCGLQVLRPCRGKSCAGSSDARARIWRVPQVPAGPSRENSLNCSGALPHASGKSS